MTDLQKQIVVTADSTGVAAGLEPGKKSLRSMGETAAVASKQATDAIGSIGDGGAVAGQKVDRATKSIIQSIERTTAVLEAGSKTSAKYFETLASQRGVDVTSLKPYLDQLDSANLKQKSAAESMDHLNFSTVGARRELLVLGHELSQGNWSKFGGSLLVLGEKTDALSLIFSRTAIGIGAAALAVGGLAAAFVLGAKESENYARAIILSGNAAGVTVSQLQAQAASISKSIGITQGAAAESLAEFVTNGHVVGAQLQRISGIAVQFQKETGQAIADTVKQFAELGKDPLQASLKLNEQYHYLTLSVYEQIKALEDQGKAAQAGALAQKAYADALESRAAALKGNLGLVEQAWRGITGAAKEAWDAMLGIGRKQTIQEQIKTAQDELSKRLEHGPLNNATAASGSFEKGNDALRQRITALSEIAGMEATDATFQAQSVARTQARAKFDADGVQFLSKSALLNREITKAQQEGAAAGATQAEIATRIAGIQKKYDTGAPDRSIQAEFQKRIDEANAELQSTQKLTDSDKLRVDGLAKIEAALKNKSITAKQAAADEALLAIAVAQTQKVELQRGGKSALESLAGIDAQLNAQQLEIDQGEKLTKVQQDANKVLTDLASGHLKVTQAVAIEIGKRLELALIQDKEQQRDLRDKKASDQAVADNAKYFDSLLAQGDALSARNQALDQSNTFLLTSAGSTETLEMATLRMTAALQRDEAARKEAAFGQNAYSDQLRKNAADIDELIGKLQQNIDLTAWRNAVQQYNDIFKEGFRTALGAGSQSFKEWAKGLAHTFEVTVIDEIYKQLAQPFVVNIVGNVLGAVGVGGAAGAAAAQGGSALAGAGNIAGLAAGAGAAGTFAGATSATAAGIYGGVGELSTLTIGEALSAGASAAATGSYAAGLGTIAGALGPIALGVAALVALTSGNGGTPSSSTGDSNATFDRNGKIINANVFAPQDTYAKPSEQSEAIVAGLEKTFLTAASNLGIKAAQANFSFSGNTGKDGKDPQFGLGGAAGTSSFYQSETKLTDDAVKLASSRAVLAALAGSDLPKYLQGVFDKLTISTASQAQIDAVLADAQAIADFHKAIDGLGSAAAGLKDITIDGLSNLVAFSGGLDKFSSNLSSYIDNFSTAAEKRAATITNITNALQGAGATITEADVAGATRDQFKAAVEAASQDLGTVAGQQLYAALLSVNTAFNTLVPAAEDASKALADANQQLADNAAAQKSWQDKLDVATGRTTQRAVDLQNDLAGTTDATTEALIRQYYAQLDLQDAASKAADAIKTAADSSKAAVEAANQALADARNTADSNVQSALAGVSRAVEAQKADLTAAFNSADASYAAQITLAQQTVSDLQSLTGSLHNALSSLSGVGSRPLDARAAAQATLQDALATARSGGKVDTSGGLGDALSTLTKVNPADFASRVEFQREIGKTRAGVQELADLTDSGLTIAERSLRAVQDMRDDAKARYEAESNQLDQAYKTAQIQVDKLNGIDVSVKTVAEAINALSVAITSRTALGTDANVATSLSSFADANGGKNGVSTYAPGYASSLDTTEAARQLLAGVYAASYDGSGKFAANNNLDPTKVASFSKELAAFTDYASKLTAEQRAALNFGERQFAKALGIPGFDLGINQVPRDMLALVHKDERILPAADNRELFARLRDPSANYAVMAAAIDRLEARVELLQTALLADTSRIATNTNKTYKQLDAVAHGADSWQERAPDTV